MSPSLVLSDPGWSGKEKGYLPCSGAAFYERHYGGSLPCSWKDHHCQKLPTWLWDRGEMMVVSPCTFSFNTWSPCHFSLCLFPAGDRAVPTVRFPPGTCRLWMPLLVLESSPPPPCFCIFAPGAQGHLHGWQTQVGSSWILLQITLVCLFDFPIQGLHDQALEHASILGQSWKVIWLINNK